MPGDYQLLFREIKEWYFFTKKRKTAAVSNTTVSVRSNIHSFIKSFLHFIEDKPEIPHSLKCNVLTLWFSLNIREFK